MTSELIFPHPVFLNPGLKRDYTKVVRSPHAQFITGCMPRCWVRRALPDNGFAGDSDAGCREQSNSDIQQDGRRSILLQEGLIGLPMSPLLPDGWATRAIKRERLPLRPFTTMLRSWPVAPAEGA